MCASWHVSDVSVSSPYVSASSSELMVAVWRESSQCRRCGGFVGAVEGFGDDGACGLVLEWKFRRDVKERAATAQYVNPAGEKVVLVNVEALLLLHALTDHVLRGMVHRSNHRRMSA